MSEPKPEESPALEETVGNLEEPVEENDPPSIDNFDDRPDDLIEAGASIVEEPPSSNPRLGAPTQVVKEATLTLKDAKRSLNSETLEALERLFKGSLTEVRALDERDQLF